MLLVEPVYNFAVLGINAVLCLRILRKPTLVTFLIILMTSLAISLAIGIMIGAHGFLMLRLTCWGWLLQAPLLCLAMAYFAKRSKATNVMAAGIFLGIVGLLIAFDSAVLEPEWLQVSEYTISSSRVHEDLTIAIVADLQTDHIGEYEERAFQTIADRKPDLVLFAGDYLQLTRKIRDVEATKLKRLTSDLARQTPHGLFAVGGNTDTKWQDLFPGDNCRIFPQTDTDTSSPIDVTGLTVPASFDAAATIARPSDRFHVVLGHSPDFALGSVDADLLVAGHTHGGQVQLPFIGPLLTMSQVPRNWASGRTELESNKTLIVSRGVGMERKDAPRVRFMCRPEIVYVTIMPSGSRIGP
ncbi:MAG: metallophosphoesterase family protein [Planctomycetales bacterium]|nr:metallophosphoesterase family protein [Planctomycetales bacterium]